MSASQTFRLFGFLFTQNFSGCRRGGAKVSAPLIGADENIPIYNIFYHDLEKAKNLILSFD